jgi:hypothetical protein
MVAALDDRVELRLSRLRREMAQFEARFIALVFTRCIRAEHLVFGEQKNKKKRRLQPPGFRASSDPLGEKRPTTTKKTTSVNFFLFCHKKEKRKWRTTIERTHTINGLRCTQSTEM